jgi:peptide-methionine (R)-S-oxide reductase
MAALHSTMEAIDRRIFLGLAGAATASGLLMFGRTGRAAPSVHFAVNRTPEQWRHALGPERFAVLREASTERPFSSPLLNEHRRGTFVCAACANPLFNSTTKFDSGTGWPSFWKVLPGAVVTRTDRSLMMERTEVLCARCGGHLGHLFDDGPKPTGLRYCMNGLALNFRAA